MRKLLLTFSLFQEVNFCTAVNHRRTLLLKRLLRKGQAISSPTQLSEVSIISGFELDMNKMFWAMSLALIPHARTEDIRLFVRCADYIF